MPHFNLINVKRLIKRILEFFASNFGRHTRKPRQPELLLLMYHRILPANDPRAIIEEPGMMVTPETFRLHMTLISTLFETMHLSKWLEHHKKGKDLPKRVCAVTFDDGWADNYEYAYPILKELDIPATIFLVSGMVGKKNTFWPERLSALVTAITRQPEKWSDERLNWVKKLHSSYNFSEKNFQPPTREQLSEIIACAKSLSDNEIHHRLDLIENELHLKISQEDVAVLNWQQVNEMCQTGLIEAGSHTCNHIRLTDEKSPTLLEHEILDSKLKIEKHTGQPVKTFCYPNGDYSTLSKSLVEQYYTGAVTTRSGWNEVNCNIHLLQRIGLHEDISNKKTKFLARISGWL